MARSYTKTDFPQLPKGIWWEEARQRFRVRLYSKKRTFRAPYFSIKSSGSIEQALADALHAYDVLSEEVTVFNEKHADAPDLTKPAGLLKSISQSKVSIKVNTQTPKKPKPSLPWEIKLRTPDAREGPQRFTIV
jgi:hypothetical protein